MNNNITKIKTLFLITLIFTANNLLYAQLTIDNTKDSDQIWIGMGETFDHTGTIKFDETVKRYTDPLLDRGLHFANRKINIMDNTIKEINLRSSPIFGVHGDSTVLKYTGKMNVDGGQAKPSIVLRDSGKFVFGKDAVIDLINSSYFTRQFWVWGDGTGVLEMEEGFVADLTDSATVPKGMGSIRLSNTIFKTHTSESLPFGYRPYGDTFDVNSHLVFENEGGSVWKVKTHSQEYKGGLWLDASMTVETHKDLTLSGVKAKTDGYTNWGGIMVRHKDSDPVTLTKTGPANLIITGDQGYPEKSRMIIEEGMVDMREDPFIYTDNKYQIQYKGIDVKDQNLNIHIKNKATLYVNTPLVRIDSIKIKSKNANLDIGLKDTLNAKYASFDGNLNVKIEKGTQLNKGDEYNIMDINNMNNKFDSIRIPNYNGEITWDTSSLYSKGIIKIKAGNTVADIKGQNSEENISNNINIRPVPYNNHFYIDANKTYYGDLKIYNTNGKMVKQINLKGQKIIYTPKLKAGIYFINIVSENDELLKTKKVIKK